LEKQMRKRLSHAQVAKVSADKRLMIVPLQVKLHESRFRSRLPEMSAEKMASSVTVPLSPEDFREKLKRLLHDAGFQEPDLVAVQSAPFGGHARYVVSVVPGKPRFALADALEGILHRPLVGGYWVLQLAEVEMISAAARQ